MGFFNFGFSSRSTPSFAHSFQADVPPPPSEKLMPPEENAAYTSLAYEPDPARQGLPNASEISDNVQADQARHGVDVDAARYNPSNSGEWQLPAVHNYDQPMAPVAFQAGHDAPMRAKSAMQFLKGNGFLSRNIFTKRADWPQTQALPTSYKMVGQPVERTPNNAKHTFMAQEHQVQVGPVKVSVFMPINSKVQTSFLNRRIEGVKLPTIDQVAAALSKLPLEKLKAIPPIDVIPHVETTKTSRIGSTTFTEGAFMPRQHKMEIYASPDHKKQASVDRLFLHETAHAWDNRLQKFRDSSGKDNEHWVSNMNEFQGARLADAEINPKLNINYPSKYAQENSQEFLAEASVMYDQSKGTHLEPVVRDTMPHVYKWFDTHTKPPQSMG